MNADRPAQGQRRDDAVRRPCDVPAVVARRIRKRARKHILRDVVEIVSDDVPAQGRRRSGSDRVVVVLSACLATFRERHTVPSASRERVEAINTR